MRPPNRHRREHSLGLSLSTPEKTQQLSSVRRLIFYFAQLNPTTLAYSGQTLTLRLGAAAVTVNLTDSAAAVGTLGASSVVFKAGDSSVQTTFQPVRGDWQRSVSQALPPATRLRRTTTPPLSRSRRRTVR